MTYSDLSKYEKSRFDSCAYCKICKREVRKSDSFEIVKIRVGRGMKYNFFHTFCVQEDSNNSGYHCLGLGASFH